MAELPDDVVQDHVAVRRKAELVLRRVVAVTVAAASVHKNPLRSIRPPNARPQPLRRLKQARRDTAHSAVAVARAWSVADPMPKERKDWGGLASGVCPHPAHSLSRGPVLIWCAVCGAWSRGRYCPGLRKPCPRRASSRLHVYKLNRLRKGLDPPPVLCNVLLDYDIGDCMIRRLVRRAFLRLAVRH